MVYDYKALEDQFDCACKDVVHELSNKYKADFKSAGPDKLSAFLDMIKEQFHAVEAAFIKQNTLGDDHEALRRIKTIAKAYAKKCIDDYGKVI